MIANGTTLTINPGVKIEFQGSYKFLVLGQLLAIGTLTDSIVFTSSNHSVGWLGLRFDNTPSTNDSSRFIYCKIEYGKVNAVAYPNNLGGAIYFPSFSKIIVSHSNISNCSASTGGAIWGIGGNFFNNIFYNNRAASCGALSFSSGNPTISNNIFSNNVSTGSSYSYGGAIGCWGTPIIHDNVFYNNQSLATDYSGGAIYCGSSSAPNIYNNKFANNSSPNRGGGAIYSYGNPTISNNIFSNNFALNGGAIMCEGSGGVLINNTFSNNKATFGGALYCTSSSPTITNSIMWGNTASNNGDQVYLNDENSDPDFYYCDIQGGQSLIGLNSNIFYLGTYSNNINQDPMFIAPTSGSGSGFNGLSSNLSLQSNSPCINTGKPTGTYPATDIVGKPRIADGLIDIGAYEYNGVTRVEKISLSAENLLFIYPNPATSILYITNSSMPTIIRLYDTLGKLVLENEINSNLSVDISNLTPGVYILGAENIKGTVFNKVVIAK